MKRLIIIAYVLLPALLNAGVILKKSGQRLEDVSIKLVSDTEIIYTTLEGTETSIPKAEVSAVLYDDGRYEEIRQQTSTPYSSDNEYSNGSDYSNAYSSGDNSSQISWGGDATEVNVIACGNYVFKFYIIDHEYDGATIEYRITYKGQESEPEWIYLGTTPFAYLTADAGKSKLLKKEIAELAEIRPLTIDNFKKMKKLEFRLSKDGYKTVIVSPLIQFDFTGIYYMISLNKLKPLADGAASEASTAPVDAYQNYNSQNATKTLTREQRRQQQDSIQQAYMAAYQLEQQRKQFVADSIKQAKLEAERLAAERKQFVTDSILQAKQAEADRIKAMEPYFITRISNKEYILNGTQMNKKAYQQFLMKNCAEAYSLYAKGTREVKAGWALFSLGLITSAPWYFISEYADVSDGWCYIGGALCASMILVSIPVMGAGYGHRKKSVNVYNQKCASPDNLLSLNFGATRNGMGLTLNW